ncbi:MAG: hypothetical protein KDI19_11685, partial [Pseudomonadales bacterium]|nr:hypothetical protein [Pseudomonadales bacterium]
MLARSILFLSILTFAGATLDAHAGGLPRYLKKAAKAVDANDPVQSAVFEALKDADNGFAAVRGAAYDDAEKQAYVDELMSFPDVMGIGSLARVRMFEAAADSAHHVTLSVPGAKGLYFRQVVVQPGSESTMDFVQFTFETPFENGANVAHGLFDRIRHMFAKDKKWLKSVTEDESLNPLYGTLN